MTARKFLLLLLCLLFRADFSKSAPAPTGPPEPLPKAIVAAWKDAGAEVGWMRPSNPVYLKFVGAGQRQRGDLSTFHTKRLSQRAASLFLLP